MNSVIMVHNIIRFSLWFDRCRRDILAEEVFISRVVDCDVFLRL